MKVGLAVALMSVALVPRSAAPEELKDGRWWRATPVDYRLGYAIGFISGYLSGAFEGWMEIHQDHSRRHPYGPVADGPQLPKTTQNRYLHVTNGQLVEGVDTVYRDFRNQAIEVADVMNVVIRQIKGEWTAEYAETYLQGCGNSDNAFLSCTTRRPRWRPWRRTPGVMFVLRFDRVRTGSYTSHRRGTWPQRISNGADWTPLATRLTGTASPMRR
jgi:hypothetical protein